MSEMACPPSLRSSPDHRQLNIGEMVDGEVALTVPCGVSDAIFKAMNLPPRLHFPVGVAAQTLIVLNPDTR